MAKLSHDGAKMRRGPVAITRITPLSKGCAGTVGALANHEANHEMALHLKTCAAALQDRFTTATDLELRFWQMGLNGQ